MDTPICFPVATIMSDEGQKKTKAKRLTQKERKLVVAVTKTANVSEAGRIAGYSDAPAAHKAMKRIERKMPEILDAHGLTDDYVVRECLKPGLMAMETQFFANKGIVLDSKDTIAWGPRHQFLETWMKLKGLNTGDGADRGEGAATRGPSLSLVFTNKGSAREFVEAIAARRSADGLIDLDASVDANLG